MKSVRSVHIRLTTDARTRTRCFSRPCSQTLSPYPGSSVQSGSWTRGETRLTLTPNIFQNSLQRTDVNKGPRSDTTSMGRP